MMSIPKSVQEAAERADQLLARVSENPAQAAPDAPKEPQETPPAQADTAIARPAITDGPDPSTFEQKFRVLQGKYNAEVPRLHQELKDSKRQVGDLQAQVNNLLKEVETLKASPTASLPSTITPEEVERYGDDFVGFVQRVAKASLPTQTAAPSVDTQDLKNRVERSEEIALTTLRKQFFKDLSEAAPNWEKLNTSDAFLQWLDGVEPLSGRTRISLFDDAYQQLDVARVATFFNDFGGPVGAASEGPPTSGTPSPRTMSGPADVPTGKRIWKSIDIQNFYNDVRRGTISMEDAAVIEKEIFAAQAEGRVR